MKKLFAILLLLPALSQAQSPSGIISGKEFRFVPKTAVPYMNAPDDSSVLMIDRATGKFKRTKVTGSGGATDTSSLSSRINQKISSVANGKGSATVIDRTMYDGFPSIAQSALKDTVFLVWKSALDHASNGLIWYTYSTDGGSSWADYDTIKINGVNQTNVATISIGFTANKLFIAYNITDNYTRFAYNTGRSAEGFIGLDSVAATASQGKVQSFGDGFTVVSDSLYFPAYAYNTPSDTTQAFVYRTSGSNPGFSVGYTIIKSKTSLTFPQGPISETSVICVQKGTFDGTSTLIAFTRSDFYKANHYQSYSTNGGTTWTKITADWGFGSLNPGAATAYPVKLFVKGNYLYAGLCVRETAIGNMSTRIFRTKVTNYATANSWESVNGNKYGMYFRSLAPYKSQVEDNGYGSFFQTQLGELKFIQYDPSSNKRLGIDGSSLTDRIRLVAVPVENVFYYEANAITNQAITSGTETAVLFGNQIFDTDRFYNSDSAFIEFPEDGFYSIEARFRVDTTSSGTKIVAKLYRVDRGYELSTSKPTGVNSGYEILDRKPISPSTDPDFTWISLDGKCYGYKGMKIRVTVLHDKGSSLNIVNDGTGFIYNPFNTAVIRVKKLN